MQPVGFSLYLSVKLITLVHKRSLLMQAKDGRDAFNAPRSSYTKEHHPKYLFPCSWEAAVSQGLL